MKVTHRLGVQDGVQRDECRPMRPTETLMRSLLLLVALVALASLLAACSSEAALPGQVVATIGPIGGAAAAAPIAGTAAPTDGGPRASTANAGTATAPSTSAEPAGPTETRTPLPTPTLAPTPKPTSAPTSHTGKVNLAGKAASDIPGTAIALPITITSVLDKDTKPSDVFAVELQAGTKMGIHFDDYWCGSLFIADPGSTSMKSDGAHTGTSLVDYPFFCPRDLEFASAVAGTYYVVLTTNAKALQYTLSLSR